MEYNKVPANSDKAATAAVDAEKKAVVATQGNHPGVKKEKFNFVKEMFKDDLYTIHRYIRDEVVMPNIRSFIRQVLLSTIEAWYNGTSTPIIQSTQQSTTRIPFDTISAQKSATISESYSSFRNLTFADRCTAENVLRKMQDKLSEFGVVSVADLYNFAGFADKEISYTDYGVGWTSLNGAQIVVNVGSEYPFSIKLPSPVRIK